MMKGEKKPCFPQLFDLLEKGFQLTLIARLVMASLWISHVHKAIVSAPNWSIGWSVFFRTWSVSSNDADRAPTPERS